ncbi:hypothetical protein GGF46_000468 [Coemansia sp. RSA 552]|nr:hypothetical protein GGF46_000468 [Coemansia sp. RSA 552]
MTGLNRAVWAVAAPLCVFVGLAVLIVGSLTPGSAGSWLLGRDAHDTIRSGAVATKAAGGTAFDVQRALDDVASISRTPHSLNDERSIAVRDYLRGAIDTAINGTDIEISDGSNGAAELRAKGWLVYWEDSSLVVRVPGQGGSSEALLVQAHYDAVPLSHGAYDDGVGVAVCLELVRSLAQQRTRQPVVINIDWGEENGLFGAMLFARVHPWAEDVRAYINLEAGGVGGRAMVFRASHPELLRAYRQAAARPCASLVGNDAMRLGIVRSDTDYSVYTTDHGIPGLDLAFTDRRSLYHTAHDSYAQVTSASVLSMGQPALDAARLIADSKHILPSLPRSPRLPPRTPSDQDSEDQGRLDDPTETAVFYDVLSRAMVVRSYGIELALNVLTALLGIATVVATQYPFTRPLPGAETAAPSADTPSEGFVLQLGRGGFFGSLLSTTAMLARACACGLFGALIFTGALLSLAAPRLAYAHLLLFTLLLFAAAVLSVTCVLAAWARRTRLPDARAMVWYALCVFRCLVLLVLVVPLNWAGIGLLYREQFYTWAAIAAAACTAVLDPTTALGRGSRHKAAAFAARISAWRRGHGEHQGRLLDDADSEDEADPASGSAWPVTAMLHTAAALRLVAGVILPMAIGMDVMIRQLVAFKDHLPDGSPPFACVIIASLDIVAFALLLAPYTVDVILDADSHWLVRAVGTAVEPRIAHLVSTCRRSVPGRPRSSSRSQISLHTNHADEPADEPIDEPADGPLSPFPRVADDHSVNNGGEGDPNERIIDLGPSGRALPDPVPAPTHASDDEPDSDDGLGRRSPAVTRARKGESPETVGSRMVYAWTGIWLFLWVTSLLLMLAGEGYNDTSRPLKVRVFHSTRIPAECLAEATRDTASCVHSRLSLSSPDSAGLAKLMDTAAPSGVPLACYTQNTRGIYQCSLSQVGNYAEAVTNTAWPLDKAVTVANITHTTEPGSHGTTIFNVSIVFSAPETRTCFIDFANHPGFSPQAYPNPAPITPPDSEPHPVISRTALPVIERARFVDARSGEPAPASEPISDRDPVFSNRIFAHKRSFDDGGLFAAEVRYMVPVANATRPAGAKIDISCYFDRADRHTPLLGAVIDAAPAWVAFTPAGNVLSTVTLVGVEI